MLKTSYPRKPTTRKPATVDEQRASAFKRAVCCPCSIVSVSGADDLHYSAVVTSSQDASASYTITRDAESYSCTCPATVVCKHVALTMLHLYYNDDARAWMRKPAFDEARDGMIAMGYSY